jgi:choline dehydrogenase-like flavoprotein
MGDDPATSVTNRDMRLHSSPNLYLAGASGFVTYGASNPTLTIAALSHRLADHLTAQLN